MHYTLAINGDDVEKACWGLFLRRDFPSYELFWLQHVVPLTKRPHSIHFKNNDDLAKLGKTPHDICIAQLHYSIIRHLYRADCIRKKMLLAPQNNPHETLDALTDAFVRIVGAQDNAFELLQRRHEDNDTYDAWKPISGKRARTDWQDDHPLPPQIRNTRFYRNNLVHGRLLPSLGGALPKIDCCDRYLDWRVITAPEADDCAKDFDTADNILNDAWAATIAYLESLWRQHLLNRRGRGR